MEHTMNVKLMDELLSSTESRLCDFKIQIYDMQNEAGRISFLKDILSIANTIRDEIGYIIVGVEKKDDHTLFQNVDTNIDENIFLTFIKGNITPEWPVFSYYTFSYKKYTLGIFEIGLSKRGPYYSKKNFGDKIKNNVIYYRYGSSNTEADDKMSHEISCWMADVSNDEYHTCLEDLEYFNTEQYNYVLFLGNDGQLNANQYRLLGKIPWSAIIDMRRGSESFGLYKNACAILERKSSVHLLTVRDERIQPFYDGKTLLWFLAGGEQENEGRQIDYHEWRKKYAPKVNTMLNTIAQYSKKQIVFFSFLLDDKMSTVVDNIVGFQEGNPLFDKYVEFKWGNEFERNEELGYIKFRGSLLGILSIFCSIDSSLEDSIDEYKLPTKNGELKSINKINWILEELEPLYIGIESKGEKDNNNVIRNSFFQGESIRWSEMNPCIAVARTKYEQLKDQLNKFLGQDWLTTRIIRLDYQAGAGATTISRMLGWFFHEKNPVVMIRKYSETTIERLKSIYLDTDKSPMLLVIDEMDIYDTNVDDLKNRLCVEQIQSVLLHIKRYLLKDNKTGNNQNILFERLDNKENKAFCKTYKSQVNELRLPFNVTQNRCEQLENLMNGDMRYRTPFLYALTSYEDNFIGLDKYVANHLGIMDDNQREIFQLISTIQFFTGLSIPLFAIEDELRYKTGRFSLSNILSREQKALLVINLHDVRVVHHCVAEAILKYICGLNVTDKRNWKRQLKYIFLYIIEKLKKNENHEMIQTIIQKLFLQQADTSNRSTHFADAVEYLEDVDKRELFLSLKEGYPQNEYVFSNTARFYLFVNGDFERALKEINIALSIRGDYTFFHIKGLILKRMLIKYVKDNVEYIRANYQEFVPEFLSQKKSIFDAFDESIRIKYENTFSYTEKILFCIEFMRIFMKYVYPEKKVEDFIKIEQNYWYMDLLDDAHKIIEDLEMLQDFMEINLGEQIDSYKSQLTAARGDVSKAIESWNNLLTRPSIYCPPIRRLLVAGYESECGGKWNELGKRKCEHINVILEKNIAEERDDSRNILQWFRFARCFSGNLEKALKYFSVEPSNPSLQYFYYGMVVFYVHIIKEKDYSVLELAKTYEKKCENLARDFSNRRGIREFYDPTQSDILSIVNYYSKRKGKESFDDLLKRIPRVSGRIKSIDKPELGWVYIEDVDLCAKFNPSWNVDRIFRKSKDENCRVRFVLGFRYEGVFAYAVEDDKSS